MKNGLLKGFLVGAGIFVLLILFFVQKGRAPGSTSSGFTPTGNEQVIAIAVKGGYTPRRSVAVAGKSSVIRFQTQNTFDCSSSVIIPALRYNALLPSTGVTNVLVPPQAKGTTLRGSCGMGMYTFEISFE